MVSVDTCSKRKFHNADMIIHVPSDTIVSCPEVRVKPAMRGKVRPHICFVQGNLMAVFSFIKNRSRLLSGFPLRNLSNMLSTYHSMTDKMTRAGLCNHFPAVGQGESGVNGKVNTLPTKMFFLTRDKLEKV